MMPAHERHTPRRERRAPGPSAANGGGNGVAPPGGPVLPHHVEAEKAVVGGILLDPARALDLVRPFVRHTDFHHPALAAIFRAELELADAGRPVDHITLAEQMRADDTYGVLRAQGGEAWFGELMSSVVTVESLVSCAKTVHARARRRRAIETLGGLAARGYDDSLDDDAFFEEVSFALRESEINASPAVDGLPTVRVASVADAGPVQWLVEGLWTDQAVGFVGAEPKSYKSWLSIYLAVCIAGGVPAFGRHRVRQGPVLAFNAEDRPQVTRARVERMCRALELDFARLDLHLVDVPTLRLDDVGQLGRLAATIARVRPILVLLDPLRDLHALDENDAQLASGLLLPLREIQRRHGTSIMLVHHMAKLVVDGPAKRRPGQRLRGSSVFHGWVDSALYLQPVGEGDDKVVKVVVEHRAAPAPEPFAVRLREGLSPAGDAAWLELIAADAVVVNDELRVLTAVRKHPRSTEKDLRERLKGQGGERGMGRERLRRSLDALVADGTVLELEQTVLRDGHPYKSKVYVDAALVETEEGGRLGV